MLAGELFQLSINILTCFKKILAFRRAGLRADISQFMIDATYPCAVGLFLLFGFIFKHLLLKKKSFLFASYVFSPTVPQLVYSGASHPLHTSPSPQGWRAVDFLTPRA